MRKFIDKYGLNAAALKWIAIIFMSLNHLCVGLCSRVGIENYFLTSAHWYLTRFVFPIFAFQIAEGMHYTRNRTKYILLLFTFALISQVPFNLVAFGKPICFDQINVLWTLGIGALVIAVIDKFNKNPWISVLVTLLGMSAGYLMNAEYFAAGIPMMVLVYYFRDVKWKQLSFSAIAYAIGGLVELVLDGVKVGVSLPDIFSDPTLWDAFFIELPKWFLTT